MWVRVAMSGTTSHLRGGRPILSLTQISLLCAQGEEIKVLLLALATEERLKENALAQVLCLNDSATCIDDPSPGSKPLAVATSEVYSHNLSFCAHYFIPFLGFLWN